MLDAPIAAPIADKYMHIDKVLYYQSLTEEPKLYINNKHGILEEAKKYPDISELVYTPQKDAVHSVYCNHDVIFMGLGFSFYLREDTKTTDLFESKE